MNSKCCFKAWSTREAIFMARLDKTVLKKHVTYSRNLKREAARGNLMAYGFALLFSYYIIIILKSSIRRINAK